MTSSIRGDRRLSPVRLTIAIVAIIALGVGGYLGYQSWSSAQAAASHAPWFAGYVDVTATPSFAFEEPASDEGANVVLSFIVAAPGSVCEPSWGGVHTLDEAGSALDLDRRIARLKQQGGAVAVAFGGQAGTELSTTCTDVERLAQAYGDVVERYGVSTIDLDIEGQSLTSTSAGERRAAAIARVQADRRAAGAGLDVWLTLPVSTTGLDELGTTFVAQMLAANVDIAGVNAMTMDFGDSRDVGESMADAAERALTATHRQLGVLYERAGLHLSDETVWSKIGATPMLGQNDVAGEVFTLDDARELNAYALDLRIGRMSVWSLNRDMTCGPNYVELTRVSDSCSGIDQGDIRFAEVLGAGFAGNLVEADSTPTTAEPVVPRDETDDPATSPYPIWTEEAAYLAGSKVVWHRNVFEAKWWTRGDLPDNPVLNEWETPWQLVGPVLPGEKPYRPATLPEGTYPDWEGTAAYEKGERVLFDGIPFEAKWWNNGESPEAYSTDPDSSPWVPLTQAEVERIALGSTPAPTAP